MLGLFTSASTLTDRPVLSTPVGAEGLCFKDKKEILIFNDLNSFEKNFIKLQNKSYYNKIIHRAKSITREKYSISNFNNTLSSLLCTLKFN